MISQGTHYNLRRQHAVFWGLVEVKVLPTAPNWNEEYDSAIIHTLLPLFVSREHPNPLGHARRCAIELLKVELPLYGYELKYLDEFQYYEDMQWQTKEDAEFYRALFSQARETKRLQLGRMYFYSSSDGDDEG